MRGFSLVTGNLDKWREAERLLGHPLERIELELPEVQASTTREVARAKAAAAFASVRRPVIVEDAGLELEALGSFPGPFVKFWEQLGGLASICRALDATPNRVATAVCVLAWAEDDAQEVQIAEGRVRGSIAREPRGSHGFGWDTIFIPDGDTRTFAEMTAAEKDRHSHRRRAWELARGSGG